MVAAAVLLLMLPLSVISFCTPDISLEECAARQEQQQADKDKTESSVKLKKKEDHDLDQLISTRSFITGRSCFSRHGYFGKCSTARSCSDRNYSYSRTCGWKHVCCQEREYAGNQRTATTRTPSNRKKTTKAPLRRRPTTKEPARKIPKGTSISGKSCGVSPVNFIFGGEEAKQGQFPFMVSFVHKYGDDYVENFCGGVLISPKHVLTAAHCFSDVKKRDWVSGDVGVRIGQTDLDQEEDILARADISEVTIHKDYQKRFPNTLGPVHDIAIVTLDRDLTSPRVTSVCLPSPSSPIPNPGVVAGWGKTTRGKEGDTERKLQFAYLDTYSVTECQGKYDKLLKGRATVLINENMLCAGNMKADSCSGDSGGPLLALDQSYRWSVAGVVSFGPSTCGYLVPGVYTRVDRYLDWIHRVITG